MINELNTSVLSYASVTTPTTEVAGILLNETF